MSQLILAIKTLIRTARFSCSFIRTSGEKEREWEWEWDGNWRKRESGSSGRCVLRLILLFSLSLSLSLSSSKSNRYSWIQASSSTAHLSFDEEKWPRQKSVEEDREKENRRSESHLVRTEGVCHWIDQMCNLIRNAQRTYTHSAREGRRKRKKRALQPVFRCVCLSLCRLSYCATRGGTRGFIAREKPPEVSCATCTTQHKAQDTRHKAHSRQYTRDKCKPAAGQEWVVAVMSNPYMKGQRTNN